jgi:hypothetical protein
MLDLERHAYQIVRVLDVLFPKHAQNFGVIVSSKCAPYKPMHNELGAITGCDHDVEGPNSVH